MNKTVPSARFITAYIALCILLHNPHNAWAGDKSSDTSQPPPQTFGNFLVSSGLKLEQHYTTNIHASAQNEKNDLVTTLTPTLAVQKNVRDHEFTFEASAPIKKHLETHEEDTVDAHVSLSALVTAKRSLKLPISISYDKAYISRHEDTSLITPLKPIQTRRRRIEGGFIYAPNRLHIQLIGHYTQERFKNGTSSNGNAIIYTDDDHNNAGLHTKISYHTASIVSPFLAFKTHKANFLRASYNGTSFNGNKRDHRYGAALAGINFDTGTLSGHIAAGYNMLRYGDNALEDLSALQLSANLDWKPVERSNIALTLSRTAMENSIIESAYIETTANAMLRYEVRNDLALNTGATFSHHNYTSGRDDMIYEGQAGMDYTLNTAIQAHANVTSRKRNSDVQNEDYLVNTIMVGITGSL
ncbi:MAG: hypothetical protein COB14_02850 [Alphaproteobacteria bacterium]|nr:MAG: hypothetical protein COB14_02850 [Alphaproteobacteria bacterium]